MTTPHDGRCHPYEHLPGCDCFDNPQERNPIQPPSLQEIQRREGVGAAEAMRRQAMPSEKFMRHHYGASGYVEQRPDDVCSRCRQKREQHFGLNFADGQHVSGVVLVCPTAVFFNNRPAVKAEDK